MRKNAIKAPGSKNDFWLLKYRLLVYCDRPPDFEPSPEQKAKEDATRELWRQQARAMGVPWPGDSNQTPQGN